MTASTTTNLDQPKKNVLAIILSAIILWGIYLNSPALENAGMAAIFLNWLPLIIGIATLLLYGLSRFITKKRNWILTALGIGFNLLYVIVAFV